MEIALPLILVAGLVLATIEIVAHDCKHLSKITKLFGYHQGYPLTRNYTELVGANAIVEAFFAKVRAGELSALSRERYSTIFTLKSGLKLIIWTQNKMYAWGNSGEIEDVHNNTTVYSWNGGMLSRKLSDEIETYIQNYLIERNLPDIQTERQVLSEETKKIINRIQESA